MRNNKNWQKKTVKNKQIKINNVIKVIKYVNESIYRFFFLHKKNWSY